MKRLLLVALVLLAVACAKPVPADHRDFIGLWKGTDFLLDIRPDGNARYERRKEGRTTTISGPAHEFTAGGFKIGVGPLSAKFKVQQAPVFVDDQWRMTVDGVPLERVRTHGGTGDSISL